MLAEALIYTAGAYVVDVVARPAVIARQARRVADLRGKPLLNVGAGTPKSSLRVAIFGPTSWGDVNVDIAATKQWDGKLRGGDVVYGDVHRLPFPPRTFGAAIASHVIEHVDNPRQAVRELLRVADEVFIIWPLSAAPHTWIHPGHQWYRRQDGSIHRLWGRRGPPTKIKQLR